MSETPHPQPDDSPRRNAVFRYLERFDDGELMRWSFRGLLVGAIAVLAIDLHEMVERNGGLWPTGSGATEAVTAPILPPALETGSSGAPSLDPREHLTTDDGSLRGPMRFELLPGGILLAEGSIEQGAAARFRTEIETRGEYVSTVRLNSPGGSLEDAMAMARIVREREYRTEGMDGA